MARGIDGDELQSLLAHEVAQLVEVLPEAEYDDEHLPDAINIPLEQLDRERTHGLDHARPVIVYCYDYQ